MNNSINTNNESGTSFVQASSFIKTPNGSLKRRKQKMFYKDIYLEKQNYVDTISERKQMSTKTISSIEKEDKTKVRTIKILGDNNNKINFVSNNDDSIYRKSITSRNGTAKSSVKTLSDVIPKISSISSKTLQYESIQHLKNIRKELDEVINIEMQKYNNKRNNKNDIVCRSQTIPSKFRGRMRNSVACGERRAVFIDSEEEEEKENMKVCMSERNVMDNLHKREDSIKSKGLIEEVYDSNMSDSVNEENGKRIKKEKNIIEEKEHKVLKSKRNIQKKKNEEEKEKSIEIEKEKTKENNIKDIPENKTEKENNEQPQKKQIEEDINLNIDLNDFKDINYKSKSIQVNTEKEYLTTLHNQLNTQHRNVTSFLSPASNTYNKTLTIDSNSTTSPMTFRKKHTFFSTDSNYSSNDDPKAFLSTLLNQKKQTRNSHNRFSSMNTSNTPSLINTNPSSTFNIRDLITSQHNQLLKELNQSTQRATSHRSHSKYNPLPLYTNTLLEKHTPLTITDLFIEKLKQQGLYGVKTSENDDKIIEEDSFYKIKKEKVKRERKPKDYYINKVKQDMKEYYYKKLIGNNI